MKTQYVCEICGYAYTDMESAETCERLCKAKQENELYPLVKMNEMVQKKQKESPVKEIYFFPEDDTGELSYIRITFKDGETYEIRPPFYDDCVDIY